MTAVSAYAPTARNSFLKHVGSSAVGQQSSYSKRLRRTIYLALPLLLIRFWRWRNKSTQGELTQFSSFTGEFQSVLNSVWQVVKSALSTLRRSSAPNQGSHQELLSAPAPELSKAQENLRQINSVLHYWFGQYPPEIAQKKLWMIASSSVQQRIDVDADIAYKFHEILLELWKGKWQEWCHAGDLYGYAGKIAAIIALDQFSRHVHRHFTTNKASSTGNGIAPIPPQEQLDKVALKISQLFTEQHSQEIECGMVPLPMYIFALMPYRHASTIENVQYVQDCIHQMDGRQSQMDAMVNRFRNATNRRMALLQDDARRNSCKGETFTDDDILQAVPFAADMGPASKHVVYKAVSAFLEEHVMVGSTTTTPIIVSLSGGVDSMVICSVLAQLQRDGLYDLTIVAVHIDYANRPESGAEAQYVEQYCESLGICFKCERIDQVTRGVTARDDYERISREVRYNLYRQTALECSKQQEGGQVVGVMLGHHRGDLRENVLSNAHKGCGPLDLSGMTAVSKNDGVVVYRPLLTLEKKSIFDYAHTFGVPYFKDTTPHWSTRGKLRNKLLPLLKEIYGDGSMDNLSSLATESDQARELLYTTVLAPFLNQVEHRPMGITFATEPWKEQGLFFWKFVLREALHGAGIGMFSDKSVVSFLERVQASELKCGWLQCRRDCAVYLESDGRIFVFYPHTFPWRKSDQYDCCGKVVEFGEENSVSVGPWVVSAALASSAAGLETPREPLLKQKAVSSMLSLFDGEISYYIETPVSSKTGLPRPLVFVSGFTRQSRPLAWKKTDLKLQSTLPLLGVDELTSAEDGSERAMVRVTLTLVPSSGSDKE